jgi:non-canonical purine NTP pyrophosphatase (RdgB/HAM1 family)
MAGEFETPRRVINHVVSAEPQESQPFRLATGNEGKANQWALALQQPVEQVLLEIKEIQDDDPAVVLHEKAKQAYVANGGIPVWAEDSSLFIEGMGSDRPGVYADQFTGTEDQREAITRSLKGKGRRAEFKVGLAIFDGEEVHDYWGSVTGRISKTLKSGSDQAFGFDDMFVPDGQVDDEGKPLPKKKRKTLAQMSPEDRLKFSPRSQIAERVNANPVVIEKKVYALPDPYKIQSEEALHERAKRLVNERSKKFAYQLEALEGMEPQDDFSIQGERPPVYKDTFSDGNISRYSVGRDTPSLGLIVTDIDRAVDMDGKPERLRLDFDGDPIIYQMGNQEMQRALRSRALEFNIHHSDAMHEHIRGILSGEIQIARRTQVPSEALEELLAIRREPGAPLHEFRALRTATFQELGYQRQSKPFREDEQVSRKRASLTGLFVDTFGIPTTSFWHNAMPPVEGFVDVATMDALSYRPVFIPRNSLFAEDMDRTLRFLDKCQNNIRDLNLPPDIEELCLSMFHMSVGTEDPKQIARDVKQFMDHGGAGARVYTTNLNQKTIETPFEIRQLNPDARIVSAPIGDKRQADLLIGNDIRVNALFVGHGGGENCTSLEGGGAANAPQLLYEMYLDPRFRHTAIGVEGGTGSAYGSLLSMVDVISLGQRGVGGAIEAGGMSFHHVNADPVVPYSGSASPETQHIEAGINKVLFERRFNDAGTLNNVEGKPGYMRNPRDVHSIAQVMQRQRELAGRTLADQGVSSISDLRLKTEQEGRHNHIIVTPEAARVAGAHRAFS